MAQSLPPPNPPSPSGWRLDHSYSRLPEALHRRVAPTPVPAPRLVIFNRPLALALGLDPDQPDRAESAALFAGNELPPGAEPLAQAYAGHQYGNFTPLGDGRAILLGEQLTPDGGRFDVQLKGAGPTPFARRGDGRAALGPMLREYVISEAMHALGIPTTRSLAVAATGEPVFREQPLPGAVLTRIASSHLRVGTFEWASAIGDRSVLQALANYTVDRHYPELADHENPAIALLQSVTDRQAALVARWLLVGFVHGVMNTDNMAISGETIDYGPCAFMDAYDPATVFSSIDRHGRYAYGNQARIAQWNLARLAEALLPLLDADEARAVDLATPIIDSFGERFGREWLDGMRAKLGLFNSEEGDRILVDELLACMHRERRDFNVTFRALSDQHLDDPNGESSIALSEWHRRWLARRSRQPQSSEEARSLMHRHNPAVIPRNHKVEEALEAATTHADLGPLHRLLEILATPYDATGKPAEYTHPPAQRDPSYRTFCGT